MSAAAFDRATEVTALKCAVAAAGVARRDAATPTDRASFSYAQRRLRQRIRRFEAGATWATLAAEGDKGAQAILTFQRQVAR